MEPCRTPTYVNYLVDVSWRSDRRGLMHLGALQGDSRREVRSVQLLPHEPEHSPYVVTSDRALRMVQQGKCQRGD